MHGYTRLRTGELTGPTEGFSLSHAIRLPCDESAIRSSRAATSVRAGVGPWVLAATILGSSMAFIDGTVVSVALPSISAEFQATGQDVQWVVESYALFLSALLLVGGSLGDRFGRRRIYAMGVFLFTGASLLCGAAPSILWLIAARAVQGIGGALLIPGSLALISASFDREHRGAAIGTWSGFSGMTAAIGPVLGGWLVNHSWRWAFWLNVPIAAVVLFLLSRVPESRNPKATKLDLPGASLTVVALGGIIYGLIESSRRGWGDPAVLTALILGFAAFAAFLVVEARSAHPMLPLGLFRSPTFAGTNALTLFLYGALACVFFFLPLDLIQVQGYTPLRAGASMLPFIIILFIFSRWSGGLIARYGARLPLLVGPSVAAVGFFVLGIPQIGGSYWTTFFPGVLILGLGMSASIAPLTTAVMNSVGEENAGIASGVNNAVSRAAGVLAIAVFGILLLEVFRRGLEQNLAPLHLPPSVHASILAERAKLAGAAPPAGLAPGTSAAIRHAIALAFVEGFRAVTRAAAVFALAGAACAWIWVGREGRGRVH